MNKTSRLAFYLIPPYPFSKDIALIHSMLEKQYGLSAANRFQVHCTIKGFYKANEKPITRLLDELDKFLNTQKPFMVAFSGCIIKPISIVMRLDAINGAVNQQLLDFRESIVKIIKPYVADDCDFIESDLGPPFKAHITLAFRDVSNETAPEILNWLRDAPLPVGQFLADNFHLLEFLSEDWDGDWWETITWKRLKSWRLKS